MSGLFPEVVFTVRNVAVRDTVLFTWVMMAVIMAAVYAIRRVEPEVGAMLTELIVDSLSSIMGRDALPYITLLGALAVFIGVANVIGVVPVLSSPTRDVNTPIALALVVFFSVHYYGVRSKGLVAYLREFADPVFLLPLEIFGQFSRTLALALRLFGNVLSGEMIVAVLFSLVPLIVPLPIVAFNMITGILQAYIFAVLAAVYLGAALAAADDDDGTEPVT